MKNSDVTNCGQHGIYFVPAFRGKTGIGGNVQVINCTVTGCAGNGIYMDSIVDLSGWDNVQLLNNHVTGCAGDGILVEGAPNDNVLISGNSTFANGGTGLNILLASPASRTAYNISANNGVADCSTFVTPQENLGDPAVAGENICCQSKP